MSEQPPATKRSRMDELELDVVVVVGDREFRENSFRLRTFSAFFNAGFRSGMKEAQGMRFEFPDKDPEEWELVKELLQPFPSQKITEENVCIVVPWFDELCVTRGLEECDRFLSDLVSEQYRRTVYGEENDGDHLALVKAQAKKALQALVLSTQYDLKDTKTEALAVITDVFCGTPSLWDMEDLEVIASLICSDQEFRQKMWDCDILNGFFPTGLSTDEWEVLCQGGLFAKFLHSGIAANKKCNVMIDLIKGFNRECTVSRLRKALKTDQECGDLFKDGKIF